MPESAALNPRGDSFQRNLYLSLAGHAVLLAFVFVRAILVPDEPIELRSAIRVDVVDLPRKMAENTPLPPPPAAEVTKPEPVKEAAKPEPVPEKPKPAPPKPETVNLNKADPKVKKIDVKKAQKDAIAKMKAAAAIEAMQNDVKKSKQAAAEKSDKKTPPAPVIAGNQKSEGDSLTGLNRVAYERYTADVRTKVNQNYDIPQWLAESDFKCQLQVLIDERGYVIKKFVKVSSGNEMFDAKAMEAVEKSSPLPPPPPKLAGALMTKGFVMNFPQ